MTLYLIGLGLWDKEDITVKGLEVIKKCKKIYLETYTSKAGFNKEELEKFYNKKIIEASRELIESKFDNIIKEAKNNDIALLIIGDVFFATTHVAIYLKAKELNVNIEVINNASIINVIGVTGLSLYKLGEITSIPFNNENIKAPIEVLNKNLRNNLHTLFLLDLNPGKNKFLTIKEAIDYLIRNNVDGNLKSVGCSRLGSEDARIKYKSLNELKNENFKGEPYCLIIPSKKLHFVEEEMLKQWE